MHVAVSAEVSCTPILLCHVPFRDNLLGLVSNVSVAAHYISYRHRASKGVTQGIRYR